MQIAASQGIAAAPQTLDRLAIGAAAQVVSVDWDRVAPAEARRLRELGLYEGVTIEVLHRGALFFRDPLAVRVGRMDFVLRARQAAAVAVAVEPSAP